MIRFNFGTRRNFERDMISKKVASAAASGTFMSEDTTSGTPSRDYVTPATYETDVPFILWRDVTTDGPSEYEMITGQMRFEDKIDTFTTVIRLNKNEIIYDLATYQTTGTGPIVAGSAIGAELGVIDGKLCLKQVSGAGSVRVAVLEKNNISSAGTIDVRMV